jgi:hypothetical protein
MSALLTLLVPALVPALSDGLRGLFARITQGKGALPQSVDESIRLMEAQTARLEALAKMDALSPNASPWVADLRGSFRYVAVGGILAAAVAGGLAGVEGAAMSMMLDMAGASMSFIIGERMYLGLKK